MSALEVVFGSLQPHVLNLLRELVSRQRFHLVPQILGEFARLEREARGVRDAHVTVARDVTDDERHAISRELSSRVGGQVEVHLNVDPSLLGGIVVRVGDQVYDASVSTRLQRLRQELAACADEKILHEVARRTGLGLRSTRPRVYVVTALSGGTGSGMFVDVASALRRELRQMGHPRAEVIGVFLVPTVGPAASRRAVANTFAALTELRHFTGTGASTCELGEDPGANTQFPLIAGLILGSPEFQRQ